MRHSAAAAPALLVALLIGSSVLNEKAPLKSSAIEDTRTIIVA